VLLKKLRIELTGWKRLELNKMIRFNGVTEANFNSILRRSFVWKPKARFFDGTYLSKHYPDCELDGVFPKRPDLKQFLSSGPAVAAGLKIQHGFELKHSPENCRQLIEDYAALGGDDGLTEDKMRFACGLKPRDRRNQEDAGAFVKEVNASQDDREDEHLGMQKIIDHIIETLLQSGSSLISERKFKSLILPAGFFLSTFANH
jgi:hypothetical protein